MPVARICAFIIPKTRADKRVRAVPQFRGGVGSVVVKLLFSSISPLHTQSAGFPRAHSQEIGNSVSPDRKGMIITFHEQHTHKKQSHSIKGRFWSGRSFAQIKRFVQF